MTKTESDVKYYESNGSTLVQASKTGANTSGKAPKVAGTYVAKLSVTVSSRTYTASLTYTIDKADITSVTFTEPTAPVANVRPESTVTGLGANYTGRIAWSPLATTFGYSTAYTATVTLTATTNYKFKSDVSIPTNWTKSATSTETALVLTRTYAETEPSPHTCGEGAKQNGQPATCTTDGFKDYYKCGGCDKLYEEAACTTGITNLAAWKTTGGNGNIPKLGHDWAYNASETTITASCNRKATCGQADITLTLIADDADYSGNRYSGAKIVDGDGIEIKSDNVNKWKSAGLAIPNITLYMSNSEGSTEGTADVSGLDKHGEGYYYAAVTVGTGDNAKTAKAAFTIGEGNPWPTVTDQNKINLFFASVVGSYKDESDPDNYWITISGDATSGFDITYCGDRMESIVLQQKDNNYYFGNADAGFTFTLDENGKLQNCYEADILNHMVAKHKGFPYDHYHGWSYAADGAALTATCLTPSCGETATVTLSATSANYSGNSVTFGDSTDTTKSISIEGYTNWTTTVGALTVEFSSDGSSWSTAAPSSSGNYTMRVYPTAETPDSTSNTAVVDFVIKNHNFTPATSTMIGITLDTPTMSSVAKAEGIWGDNSAVHGDTQNNDMIVFGNGTGSNYKVGIYSDGSWTNDIGDAYEKSLAEIKAHITTGYRVYVVGNVQEPHTHSFNYVATGSKLTATSTCHNVDGCAFDGTEKTAELTLTASSTNYSGSPAIITIEGKDAWENATIGVPEIKYFKGTEELTEAPTTPGDYTAKISAGNPVVTASVDYTISVAKNEAETVSANNVVSKINEIGTVENTDACKAKIDAARTAYNALAEHLRSLVTNYNVLTTAEAKYVELKAAADKLEADTLAANAVDTLIKAIGTVEYTDACKAKIDAAKKAYDALTADQKKLVKELKVLEDAEKAYEVLKLEAEKTPEPKPTPEPQAVINGTNYDTIQPNVVTSSKGKVTGVTVSSNSISMNSIVTVNAKLKVTALDGKWKVVGYSEDRVTPATLGSAKWLAADGTKKDAKTLKKYAKSKYYKATKKKAAKTVITAGLNKKDIDGVYAVKLVDENGKVLVLNIECNKIAKISKKDALKVTELGKTVSANDIITMADGESVKTVSLSFAGKDKNLTKSALNNNVIEWKVGTGKKVQTIKCGEVTKYTTKKGDVIAYLTVTEDGSVKVLAGEVKGKVALSAKVYGKTYKATVTIKK